MCRMYSTVELRQQRCNEKPSEEPRYGCLRSRRSLGRLTIDIENYVGKYNPPDRYAEELCDRNTEKMSAAPVILLVLAFLFLAAIILAAGDVGKTGRHNSTSLSISTCVDIISCPESKLTKMTFGSLQALQFSLGTH